MSNMTRLDMAQVPIVIRFGDMTLDFGVGTIPLIFLRFYRHIEGLNGESLRDAEAMLLVHVLALRADHDFELRLANLPMAQSYKSRERYLAKFRQMGIIFTSRVYYSRSEMERYFGVDNVPSTPRLKAQRWDLSALFLTLSLIAQDWLEGQQAMIAEWKAQGEQGHKPIYQLPDDYTRRVELPFDVAQRILNGEYFPTPPDYILNLAERICSSVPGQNDLVRPHVPGQVLREDVPPQNGVVREDVPPQSGVVREDVPPQSGVVRATYLPKMGWSSNTTATAAGEGGEAEIFRFFAQLAEIERKPTGAELETIRRLLTDGIPQDTIRAGIKRAFRTRRHTDGTPTLAQCARVVRRLHHRKHRENDARTTDCPAAAGESTTGEVAASGLA
ncbi:MAG: hypothetical protein DRI52_12645, partial [Chloroflexi bacterium]